MSTTNEDVITQLNSIIQKQQAELDRANLLLAQFDKFIVDVRRVRIDLEQKQRENAKLRMWCMWREKRLTDEIRFLVRENKKLKDTVAAKDAVQLAIIVTPPIHATPSFSNIPRLERRNSDSMVTSNPHRERLKSE